MEEAWSAAFRVAESMTHLGCRVSAEDFAALESQWNAGQIVEIVAVIGLFNYFNRFAIALDVPPTK